MLSCCGCKNKSANACRDCVGWIHYESDTLINPVLAMDIDKEMKMLAKLRKILGVESSERRENNMKIKKVIFNDPVTVVLWEDGAKTIVKAGENDIYDPEKGLAMAIAKKALGNKGNYYEVFKKWLPEKDFESLCEKIRQNQTLDKCFGHPEDRNKTLYSISELAKKLGVSKSTINKKCIKGYFPEAFKEGNRWIIPIVDEEFSDK